ncbi:hypothetical protein RF11_06933 [Thelohanellus kitauei]|uniref:Uncharacterized protein n=1 Tax=Thelohanellus kitauei TaxID=669202 RepID=A0A0C2MWF6_THEKT|nr:hypothetical protein RF11_06933 [Thelohanellus kitauei]
MKSLEIPPSASTSNDTICDTKCTCISGSQDSNRKFRQPSLDVSVNNENRRVNSFSLPLSGNIVNITFTHDHGQESKNRDLKNTVIHSNTEKHDCDQFQIPNKIELHIK